MTIIVRSCRQPSFSLTVSILLTLLSAARTLSSHSAQTSPCPTTPTSSHRSSNLALLARSSAISRICKPCTSFIFSSLGCKATNSAEVDAGAMGRSLTKVRRDRVPENEVAWARIIEVIVEVSKVVGGASLVAGINKSGYCASLATCQYNGIGRQMRTSHASPKYL